MIVVYILTSLATMALSLYLYFTRTFNYWRALSIPGPTPVPLFGNVMESALRRTLIMFVMKKIYDDFPDEKLVGIYKMTSPALLIRDPDIVKLVMIKDFDYFTDHGVNFSKDELGTNLFHADEKTWRILRDKFTPLFTSGKLKSMFYLINERGDNFMKYLEGLIQTEPEQEVCELVQNFTMASIAACAFGLDIDTTIKSDTIDALKTINQKIFNLSFNFELDMMYPGILSIIGGSLFPAEVTKFFYHLVDQIITARSGVPSNRKDFMDLLLELREAKELQASRRVEGSEKVTLQITDGVIAAQAFSFYAAGYETSATTVAYMFYHLALNPDIQEKVVTEIKEVLERHGGVVTYDALMDLTYMDKVFHETLRMHPQGDPFQRAVTADYKVPGTGLTLKKGQIVNVSVYGLHNDPKYWPDPTKFDPDRFSPENSANRHPAVYMPFGIGPRNCIGTRFAKIQTRLCLVKLLQRFRLEATEHTRRQFQHDVYRMVVYPIGGIKMNFIPRE